MAYVAPADTDPLFESLRESLLRAQHTRITRATPPVNDLPERTRAAVRQLARSRIAGILRQLRAALGYSYEEVQARTGISQQVLYDVEFRERRLTLDELQRLADCYAISLGDLLGVELD